MFQGYDPARAGAALHLEQFGGRDGYSWNAQAQKCARQYRGERRRRPAYRSLAAAASASLGSRADRVVAVGSILALEDALKVLFIGGTGTISSACVELAVALGMDVLLLNRGNATRPIPANVPVLQGDIRDKAAAAQLVNDLTFDVVVNFVAFTPEHIIARERVQVMTAGRRSWPRHHGTQTLLPRSSPRFAGAQCRPPNRVH
jgi:hypothetical protein